jgi:hypothetical protein
MYDDSGYHVSSTEPTNNAQVAMMPAQKVKIISTEEPTSSIPDLGE